MMMGGRTELWQFCSNLTMFGYILYCVLLSSDIPFSLTKSAYCMLETFIFDIFVT